MGIFAGKGVKDEFKKGNTFGAYPEDSTKERENNEYYEFELDGNIVCEVFDDEDLLVIRELIGQVIAEKEGKEVHHG